MRIHPRYAVAAGTVFDGSGTLKDGAVIVEDSLIAWVGPRSELPPSIVTHALPDEAWLAPGFIDVQVNGGGDVLFNADTDAINVASDGGGTSQFRNDVIVGNAH